MLYQINPERCINCGSCRRHCPVGAVRFSLHHHIDLTTCTGCTLCYVVCPMNDDDDVIYPIPSGRIVHIPKQRKRLLRDALLRTLQVQRKHWRPLSAEVAAATPTE